MAGPAKRRAQLEKTFTCNDDVLSTATTRASSLPKTPQANCKSGITPKLTPPPTSEDDPDDELYRSMFGIDKNEVPDAPPVLFNTPFKKDGKGDEDDEPDDWVITPSKEPVKKSLPLLNSTSIKSDNRMSSAIGDTPVKNPQDTLSVSSRSQAAKTFIVKDFEEIEELGLTNDTSSSDYDSDEAEGMFLVPSKPKSKPVSKPISVSKTLVPIPTPKYKHNSGKFDEYKAGSGAHSPTSLALANTLIATNTTGYPTAHALLIDQASLLALSASEARMREEAETVGMSAKEKKEYLAQKAFQKFREDEERKFKVPGVKRENPRDERLFPMDEDVGRGKGFWDEAGWIEDDEKVEGDGNGSGDGQDDDEDGEEKGGLMILEEERMK